MRGIAVASRSLGDTTTAAARVSPSSLRYLGCARNAMSAGPLERKVPTRCTTTSGSPINSPPSRATISASRNGPCGIDLLLGGRAVVERADHLVGDVDARARKDRFLEDDVELLGLGDLAHRAIRALEDPGKLLVAALVEVLAEFALLALELAIRLAEFALAPAALRLRHRHDVLLERLLHALEAVRHLRHLLLSLGELAFQLLLCALRRRGVA